MAVAWVGPLVLDSVLGATSERKESMASESTGRDLSSQLPMLLESNHTVWKDYQSYLYADSVSQHGTLLGGEGGQVARPPVECAGALAVAQRQRLSGIGSRTIGNGA